MTRLEHVIEQVKSIRKLDEKYRAWIYDDDGNIDENVIIGDIIPFLEELKDYEIRISDKSIKNLYKNGNYDFADNTYNYCANCDCNLQIYGKKINDGYLYIMSVHLYGDIRGGYSEPFAIKTNYELEFYELESVVQQKMLTERYCVDINIFHECYDIYDYYINDYIECECCEIEKDELLNAIKEKVAG